MSKSLTDEDKGALKEDILTAKTITVKEQMKANSKEILFRRAQAGFSSYSPDVIKELTNSNLSLLLEEIKKCEPKYDELVDIWGLQNFHSFNPRIEEFAKKVVQAYTQKIVKRMETRK